METPTDMEIVRRVQTGDAEAFGELVNRYSGRIYALALAMVRDAQRAEDVTQEAFIRAYEHLDGFRGASAFGTWLYRIAYNRAAGRMPPQGLTTVSMPNPVRWPRIVRRTVRRGDGRADAPCVGTASSRRAGVGDALLRRGAVVGRDRANHESDAVQREGAVAPAARAAETLYGGVRYGEEANQRRAAGGTDPRRRSPGGRFPSDWKRALWRRSSCGTGGGVNAGRSRQWLATARLPSRR